MQGKPNQNEFRYVRLFQMQHMQLGKGGLGINDDAMITCCIKDVKGSTTKHVVNGKGRL